MYYIDKRDDTTKPVLYIRPNQFYSDINQGISLIYQIYWDYRTIHPAGKILAFLFKIIVIWTGVKSTKIKGQNNNSICGLYSLNKYLRYTKITKISKIYSYYLYNLYK